MNFLILSASIGSGHIKAAQALQKILGNSTPIIDFTARDFSTLNWLTKKSYLNALKFCPDLYDKIYNLANKSLIGAIARVFSATFMYPHFKRLLISFEPAVVICTHPFPLAAADFCKTLTKCKNFTLAAVLTDFSLHEMWLFNHVDYYFVATGDMKLQLAKFCRPNQKIFATGIPIAQEFFLVKKCHSSKPVILIMGGGLGLGSIEKTLSELNDITFPLKILVVAGHNQALLARLKNFRSKHSLYIFGFVSNIHRLMACADLLISKPGALTLSEAFAVGLPIILHDPIPGPEALNAAYAVANGAAISLNARNIAPLVQDLLNDADKIIHMQRAAMSLASPLAAELIIDALKKP